MQTKPILILVIASLFLLTIQPLHASENLTIATWNIYWLTDSKHNQREANHYDRLKYYARLLDADVIALQEVENTSQARQVFGTEYEYYFSNRRGGPGTQRVGVAIRKTTSLTVSSVREYKDLDVGGVRYGLDLILTRNDLSIRLLVVHLKSGCFSENLAETATVNFSQKKKKACEKLRKQRQALEQWIDMRATETIPFVVLGDFNRRFEIEDVKQYTDDQGLWPAIDDPESDNPYEDLTRINDDFKPQCWNSKFGHYIDHIVIDPRAKSLVISNSFRELVYEETSYQKYYKFLSDHCPISIKLAM